MRGLMLVTVLLAACEGGSTVPDAGISSAQQFGACDPNSWSSTPDWQCSLACMYEPTTSAMGEGCDDGYYFVPDGRMGSHRCAGTFMYGDVRGCCLEQRTAMLVPFVQCP
jgi:hypothetical protein